MPLAKNRARSISIPMIWPSFVVMFNGGMLAAVPTTSSFFSWIRSSTGEIPAARTWPHTAIKTTATINATKLLVFRISFLLYEN